MKPLPIILTLALCGAALAASKPRERVVVYPHFYLIEGNTGVGAIDPDIVWQGERLARLVQVLNNDPNVRLAILRALTDKAIRAERDPGYGGKKQAAARAERDEDAYREYLRPAEQQTLFHEGEIIKPAIP